MCKNIYKKFNNNEKKEQNSRIKNSVRMEEEEKKQQGVRFGGVLTGEILNF